MKVEGGQLVSVGISIGAAEFGRDGQTLEELLIKADLAMYTTKAQRKLGRHKLEQTGELVRSPESGVRSLPSSTGV
jgi:GGDEF domain-containing protein